MEGQGKLSAELHSVEATTAKKQSALLLIVAWRRLDGNTFLPSEVGGGAADPAQQGVPAGLVSFDITQFAD